MFIPPVPPVSRVLPSFRSTNTSNNATKTTFSTPLSVLPIPHQGQNSTVCSSDNSDDGRKNRPDSTDGTNTGTGDSTDGNIKTTGEVENKKAKDGFEESANPTSNAV